MISDIPEIQYQRRGTAGTLRLQGVVGIAEATALREAARKAAADDKAQRIAADFSETERIDVTAAQILIALQRETLAAGRDFQWENVSERLTPVFALFGITGENG